METPPITFDQLPHLVSGLSEKLDRVLYILEKLGIANPIKNAKPSRRLVYAKEACQIIGKSLSSLYRGIKAPNEYLQTATQANRRAYASPTANSLSTARRLTALFPTSVLTNSLPRTPE